jgi:hypothetical protein
MERKTKKPRETRRGWVTNHRSYRISTVMLPHQRWSVLLKGSKSWVSEPKSRTGGMQVCVEAISIILWMMEDNVKIVIHVVQASCNMLRYHNNHSAFTSRHHKICFSCSTMQSSTRLLIFQCLIVMTAVGDEHEWFEDQNAQRMTQIDNRRAIKAQSMISGGLRCGNMSAAHRLIALCCSAARTNIAD